MKNSSAADLAKVDGLAFEGVAGRKEWVERYHGLEKSARSRPDHAWSERHYGWAFVPLSLWPIDLRGVALHVLDEVASGRGVDGRTKLMCSFLPQAPPEEVCEMIRDYEHAVKAGNYESLIAAQYKFD